MPQLHRNMLEVLGIKNADKLVPLPDDQKPRDPVAENMSILKGDPVKAFLNQDHKSHITVHMSMIQDPTIAANIGQNPKAPVISAALMAHIAEHTGYQYRKQIEDQLGMSLPAEDEQLPPEIEKALSGMMAQAAQQALQMNQQQAAQQQSQQQSQDPLVQMQQQELQLKQGELQIKQGQLQLEQQKAQAEQQFKMQELQSRLQMEGKKLAADMAAKADSNDITRGKMQADMQLKGTQMGAQIRESQTKQAFEQEHAGVKLGAQMAKDKAQQEFAARQAAMSFENQNQPTPEKSTE
jgi:hypothetical protein